MEIRHGFLGFKQLVFWKLLCVEFVQLLFGLKKVFHPNVRLGSKELRPKNLVFSQLKSPEVIFNVRGGFKGLNRNSASWQWIAGCGADAAPYFRIFNPVTQGQKFDPDGEYIRKYIPEISDLSNKYLFNPWEAPQEELDRAGVVIGKDYPKPIIDLKLSRQNALEAFKSLKKVDD